MQDKLNAKELDQKLAKLKEIGLKEISKSTKLASSKIEDVLEKRFDRLDRVRARGFINILEREYEIDLSDWLKAQQEHTQRESIASVSQVIANQNEQNQSAQEVQRSQATLKTHEEKVLDIALKAKPIAHSQKESYIWFYAIFGVILFMLVGYFAYKAFINDRTSMKEMSMNDSRIQREVSQEQNASNSQMGDVYDGIFFDLAQSSTNEYDKPSTQGEVEQKDFANQEQNLSQSSQVSNIGEMARSSALDQRNTTDMATHPQADINKDDILHVQSAGELWLGVISLDSGTKQQFLYKNQYDIKLEGRMLFVMGHANFTLTLNGENISHSAKPPVRMYYDGETLSSIGFTRFKQLNGGVEW